MANVTAKDVLCATSHPSLLAGEDHTSSSALTGARFIWAVTGEEHGLPTCVPQYSRGKVFVGAGKGLQGRFQQSVRQVVGAVLEAQQRPIALLISKL
ncbi:hypothetical protein PENNAL_c0014G05230 [Penicillium nalgiovense]|uniref:Uncharacterized protein n=1 Tax=Penicillium nalgiovense TaxID=60175 RepID=A0A1V6YQ07_PENNA|nr:hypothetical protein PENNAL_c0014G05230 [Penicillium nalgiovense]